MSGAYATVGPRLVERGYAAIPVMPDTKRPGALKRGEWVGMTNWREEYQRRLPSRFELQIWSQSNAGVCVVCGPASKHLIGVDIDTDDSDIRNAILAVLPATTVSKRGQKGDTRFFLGPAIAASKSWNVTGADGKKTRACDLIGPGRQTLLPPTIHPDTKQPYVWTGSEALEDIDPDELPELTPEHVAAIDAALARFGYEPEPERMPATATGSYDDETPIHRRLNDTALSHLGTWIPGLKLWGCKSTRGGYEAVATWRASSTGQALEKRKRSLKINAQGIVDFGDGPRNYTPLNLWMAACECDLDTAFKGLADALGWNDAPIQLQAPERAPAAMPEAPRAEITASVAMALPPEPAPVDKVPDGGQLESLTHCAGLIGKVVDWICATARRPNRELALGVAVTVIGTLIGRRVAGPTRSATHLYVLGLAPTGSGKQHPIDCLSLLMRAAKAEQHMGPSEFISMPAVINMLARKPLAVCAQDEFGRYLQRINSRKASGFENSISKIMRTVWGINFGEYMTPEWAGRSASVITSPALSIYGLSTPEEFYESLQDGELKNGFLNRFLVISTKRTPAVVPELEPGYVPDSITAPLNELYRWGHDDMSLATARLNDSNLRPEPVKLHWASAHAAHAYTEFEHEIEERIDRDESAAHFIARSAEIAIRLATIRAVGRWGPYGEGPTIDLSDIEWGRDLALRCGLELARDASAHMAENDRQQWSNRILGIIRRRGSASMRQIQQHIRNAIKGGEIKDIIDGLCEAGVIEKMLGEMTGGRRGVTGYRYTGE